MSTLLQDTLLAPDEEEITSGQKWWAAAVLGMIFVIMASPCLSNLFHYLFKSDLVVLLLEGVLFFLLVRWLLV